MAFSGDTLPHSPLWRRAADNANDAGRSGFDFGPMLVGLSPLLDTVDVAVCHLETPIAPAGEELSTMPLYGVPAEIADAIAAAGYDRCSTASNHSLDRGAAGIDRTVEVLAAAGLDQSGMARTPDEIEPRVFEAGGIAISHLSYTWSYNGLRTPDGEPWRSALIDPLRIVEDAREARRRGAEVVVVSVHAGSEGDREPTRYQRDVAEWLAASGEVDLIVGHHAHVVQPIEQVHGVWVLFGLGNILSNLPTSDWWPAAAQDGVVVTVAMHVTADGGVEVARPVAHATWVDKEAGWVVRLVDESLAGAAGPLPDGKRFQLERSRARTAEVVGGFMPAPPERSDARFDTIRAPHQNSFVSSCIRTRSYASVYMAPSGVSCTMPAFAGSAHSGRSSGIEGEEPNTS
jgi:poly-gamma-glutamate synthesis protein (capsule biosynthesis protein)